MVKAIKKCRKLFISKYFVIVIYLFADLVTSVLRISIESSTDYRKKKVSKNICDASIPLICDSKGCKRLSKWPYRIVSNNNAQKHMSTGTNRLQFQLIMIFFTCYVQK